MKSEPILGRFYLVRCAILPWVLSHLACPPGDKRISYSFRLSWAWNHSETRSEVRVCNLEKKLFHFEGVDALRFFLRGVVDGLKTVSWSSRQVLYHVTGWWTDLRPFLRHQQRNLFFVFLLSKCNAVKKNKSTGLRTMRSRSLIIFARSSPDVYDRVKQLLGKFDIFISNRSFLMIPRGLKS